ncbi:cytochrome c oxidase accessory protein CcoG [Cytophaga hutchinsonii]|uniref:Probable ferredoxin n=1 Tax=Cytophaga hutchinsonii (strain ATCC 33406 / DSM 1761 / CIP 103989 / NBRC 15051 / NCIMB 9469 / D465) TaxID=269798 RepID=A0A6N4SQ02_CYTH3|nr:cytochrome c oxidase accessory protein CcoG [Cytophaga hutchinsonii]ABG58416.1 probable ferredoxin [Cytophaga hutchinsonii ATCC 33406]SFX50596.1 cytochrome c oxidase accessory protein FixG [Cytophaga hutchinsonii ATCC 33406]
MEAEHKHIDQSFRDHISTVDAEGKRIWLYPKKPKGFFTSIRNYVSYVFLTLFIVTPFIRIEGDPLILLNVLERKFILFGIIFWPQDFHLFLLAMISFVVFIVLFTMIYGRVFCGWVCPQTIFMEMVFRKIEYWIEGDYRSQIALNNASLTLNKLLKKLAKHAMFLLFSFCISNLFLTYIIGTDEWQQIVSDNPLNHIGGFSSILIFTGVFYGVYARFREQICTTICPYGRLQGVLLDKNSINVAYDYIRGERRGHLKRGEDREIAGKGDCIDCHQCVHVCPTGIDIRNGVQMECINCTACIDECDSIMDKIGKPHGLIRYASEEGIRNQISFTWTRRVIAYTGILLVLVAAFVTLLATRPDVETTVLRTPGMLYQQQENERYSNLYNFKIVNKTRDTVPISFNIIGQAGEIKLIGQIPEIVPNAISEGAFFILLDQKDIHSIKTPFTIGVYKGTELIDEVSTSFVGPVL